MYYICPLCESDNIQKLSVIYEGELRDVVAGEYELKIEMDKDKKEIPYKEATQ